MPAGLRGALAQVASDAPVAAAAEEEPKEKKLVCSINDIVVTTPDGSGYQVARLS